MKLEELHAPYFIEALTFINVLSGNNASKFIERRFGLLNVSEIQLSDQTASAWPKMRFMTLSSIFLVRDWGGARPYTTHMPKDCEKNPLSFFMRHFLQAIRLLPDLECLEVFNNRHRDHRLIRFERGRDHFGATPVTITLYSQHQDEAQQVQEV